MSKWGSIILVLLAAALGGCGGVKPTPGMSGVVVTLIAEPKTGVVQDATSIDYSALDPGVSSGPTGRMEKIDYANLGDIIVWLEPESKSTEIPPSAPLKIDPSAPIVGVQPVSVGQILLIRNTRAIFSPYVVADGDEFVLNSAPPSEAAAVTVRNPGLIEILTDPKRPPIAVLYAVPSPWVARGHSGETITFSNIRPGRYKACVCHPRLPGSIVELLLIADKVSPITLRVSVNNLAVPR